MASPIGRRRGHSASSRQRADQRRSRSLEATKRRRLIRNESRGWDNGGEMQEEVLWRTCSDEMTAGGDGGLMRTETTTLV
jgi:hypothetical protein